MPLKPPSKLIYSIIILLQLSGCGPQVPITPTPAPVTIRFAYLQAIIDYQSLADQYHKLNPNVTVDLVPLNGRISVVTRRWMKQMRMYSAGILL